jgi:hypothetical protein
MQRALAVWISVAAATLGACGQSPPATLAIVDPPNGATVPLGTDAHQSVSIAFTTTHFTVQATCNGASACGQVWVLVDGATCDPVGLAYDALAVSSPAAAEMSSCPSPAGAHLLTLELHRDDGTPVLGATGQTVSASVNVTTQ